MGAVVVATEAATRVVEATEGAGVTGSQPVEALRLDPEGFRDLPSLD